MSQEMPDGKFEWGSVDECRNMEQLLNTADGRITILDLNLFDNQVLNQKNNFILKVDLEYPSELHERDDDYPLAPEVMTIEPEITGEKQQNMRAQYVSAACPFNRKLISSFLPTKHYVVVRQLFRFDLDRGMRLVKVHRAIRFNSFLYVASYIANNTDSESSLSMTM